jgi:very-short-patch-repair endonuclease
MKFKDLVSPKNKPLRFDFYIKSHNLLIEFDGKQHFKKVRWTITETQQDIDTHYNYIVECDHLKNEYADANKIKLYRIKYTEIKNIDNILKVLLI